jgi:predicted transcriptional regulator
MARTAPATPFNGLIPNERGAFMATAVLTSRRQPIAFTKGDCHAGKGSHVEQYSHHPGNTSIQAAAELMRQMDIGMLPVTEDGRIVGTLTDRDIAIRGVAEGADPGATPAREVMTREVVSCYDDQDAREVANAMELNKVRRVIVVNRKTKPSA